MVSVSKYRAISIEGEVEPLAERIRRRNARLELGVKSGLRKSIK